MASAVSPRVEQVLCLQTKYLVQVRRTQAAGTLAHNAPENDLPAAECRVRACRSERDRLADQFVAAVEALNLSELIELGAAMSAQSGMH